MPESGTKSRRFRERAELLDFLLEVTATISETLDLDQLLERLAEIVAKVVPYDLFAVLLYNERLKALRIRYAIGHRPEVVKNLVIPLGEGITGAAASERQPILVADVRNDPRYLNALDAVRAELAVPMIARGKLVGVIDVQSTRENALSNYDLSILRLIASRVAYSIDHARLYRRVERQNRTVKTLANISHEFSSILDLDELLRKIADTMRGVINYDAFSIYLVDFEQKLLRHRFSVRYDQEVEVDNIPLGKGITGAAAESREPVRVEDTMADSRYIASHPSIRSEVAIPLMVQDRVVGVMDLESGRLGYYTEEHVRTLQLLAPQIATSVENARLYEEIARRKEAMEADLKAARKLQKVMLPRQAPEIRNLEIGIGLRPAREISGDLYDFFESGSEDAVIAFGDSSGKGAAAALYGALVSGLLRTLAPRRRSPALLLQSLNETLLERRMDAQYVTLLVMLWHAHSGCLTMANAGATPPLICRGKETIKPKHLEGVPLGLLEDREYDEVRFQTAPGDVVVLFSDGVADQTGPGGQEYSSERLAGVIRKNRRQSSQKIVEAIYGDLDAFRGGSQIADDQTLLVLKVSH